MKAYSMKRIVRTIIIIVYTFLLLSIIEDRKPFENISIVGAIIAILAGSLIGIFLFKERINKQYKEEKRERDERYVRNKNAFSYFFLLIIALLFPIFMGILSIQGIQQISIKHLALVFVMACLIYVSILGVIKKKF